MSSAQRVYDRWMQISWLAQQHRLLAWLSAIAALVTALIAVVKLRRISAGTPIKRNTVLLRAGYLLCVAVMLSTVISSEVRTVLGILNSVLLATIILLWP